MSATRLRVRHRDARVSSRWDRCAPRVLPRAMACSCSHRKTSVDEERARGPSRRTRCCTMPSRVVGACGLVHGRPRAGWRNAMPLRLGPFTSRHDRGECPGMEVRGSRTPRPCTTKSGRRNHRGQVVSRHRAQQPSPSRRGRTWHGASLGPPDRRPGGRGSVSIGRSLRGEGRDSVLGGRRRWQPYSAAVAAGWERWRRLHESLPGAASSSMNSSAKSAPWTSWLRSRRVVPDARPPERHARQSDRRCVGGHPSPGAERWSTRARRASAPRARKQHAIGRTTAARPLDGDLRARLLWHNVGTHPRARPAHPHGAGRGATRSAERVQARRARKRRRSTRARRDALKITREVRWRPAQSSGATTPGAPDRDGGAYPTRAPPPPRRVER